MTFPNESQPAPRSRYGCHECREDSELVMGGRAPSHVREQYEQHLQECRDCRRVHRILLAVYEGPFESVAPLSGLQQAREFSRILERTRHEAQVPWHHGLSAKAGVVALSASAAVLALALVGLAPNPLPHGGSPGADETQASAVARADAVDDTVADDLKEGGIDHPAQSYGRVVGGSGLVLTPQEQQSTSNTFPVGTTFRVGLTESLQVALAGKLVGNFTPGSEVEWTTASPALIELSLTRGLIGIRYDRKRSDPILHVRTPTALVRVVGTVFTVQVDSEQNTVVSVLRGEVEVLDPETKRLSAPVEAGYRFDTSNSSYGDVGKIEVGAALPLSNERSAGNDPADPGTLADGKIPEDWIVPGLPTAHRTLAHVPTSGGRSEFGPRQGDFVFRPNNVSVTDNEEPILPEDEVILLTDDDGGDVIEHLMRDVEATRRKELRGRLERCQTLYEEDRYRAAECLAHFLEKYGRSPQAAEGYLLVGILRMDYALDYRAADTAFQEFLRRSPRHPRAELAMYRLWLSATEDGRIGEAIERGRTYLGRFPQGRYVGKVLQRFPELKSEL